MEEENTDPTSRRRDIVIGVIILILLAIAVYFILKPSNDEPEITIDQEPSVEEKLEESFRFDIPDDIEKVELKAVKGEDFRAIATRKYEDGIYTHTVIADLPDPVGGTFYEGWLMRGNPEDDNFDVVSAGKMVIAKGGYLLNFESSTDYSDYQNVVITLEKVADNNPEEHILDGSF